MLECYGRMYNYIETNVYYNNKIYEFHTSAGLAQACSNNVQVMFDIWLATGVQLFWRNGGLDMLAVVRLSIVWGCMEENIGIEGKT